MLMVAILENLLVCSRRRGHGGCTYRPRAYQAPGAGFYRRPRGCVSPSIGNPLSYMGIKSVAATSAQWSAWRIGLFRPHRFVEIALHHVAFKPFVVTFDPVAAID